jgi:DNA-directed RNA polymerase specialized sigma24 family protein
MLMTTDTVLVQRASLGDPDAFAAIYDESFRCVWAFAVRRTGARDAAEALTERILARVFATLGEYAGDVPFAAWLHATAQEVARGATARRPSRVVRAKPPVAHVVPR